MSILSIVLIIIIGFLLFLLEILVIPGITVAAIAASILVIGGVICGYAFHDPPVGNIILLGTLIGMILLLIMSLKLKTWKKFGLKAVIDGKVGVIGENSISPGDEGITVSKLAPMGKAMIGGKLYEVSSDGEYVESNKEIIISRIEGSKIFVETKK